MTRKNFLGRFAVGLAGLALLKTRTPAETPQMIARRYSDWQPRSQLPPKEIRRITNLGLQLRDKREIPGWYDSTGIWYGIGLSTSIDREVVQWRVREIFP